MAIRRLAFLSIIVTYLLIVFGGYVASSNSGMGCGPEWPLCNGSVIPILKGTTLVEFTHRVIGAILGIMTVILFFKIVRAKVDSNVRRTAWGMLFLLIIQVLLGAVVVIKDLPAIVVTIHLLIAMLYLFSLVWIWRNSVQEVKHVYSPINDYSQKLINRHLNILMILLILTLGFGAYIKHQSYGLACEWLNCRDSLIPVTTPEILQTLHRFLAIVSTVYILLLTYKAITKKWGASLQKRLAIVTLLTIFQLLIGVLTIKTSLNIPWAVLHLAIGTAVFVFVGESKVYLGSITIKTKLKVSQTSQHQSLE
ncbi:heme A synthase [Bacillus sp. CGMCC 1.16607]|uniref:COX15/CtaA family protein n=1 Tax=Bacillus sp. CGMCC 1.16607 TaxID=3351842 RepID=UPI00363ABDA3